METIPSSLNVLSLAETTEFVRRAKKKDLCALHAAKGLDHRAMNSFAEPGASFRAVLTTQVPNQWAIYSPS
jgi:hypothetical protein